ncbi:hypothetical protein J14TS2_28990 [Bacillus sp. J14TS2]|nr:hypothetical protein J14TS2_28990 [Bacillus sp. J14TS2]
MGFETEKAIAVSSTDWHVVITSRNQQRGNEPVIELIFPFTYIDLSPITNHGFPLTFHH